MCSGAGSVASGLGRVSGMCVAGHLLEVALSVEDFARVTKEFVVCGGRLSGVMNCYHEVCMVVSNGVVSLGSFLSSMVVGSRLALRVSREVSRAVLGPGLSPFGSLAIITLVGWIWSV